MTTKALDAILDSLPERGIPACDLSVSVAGKEVYRRTVGHCDAEKTKPLTENNTYWVYSITKTITCAAALKLVEEGRLGLDDPVYKYLPEYKHLVVKRENGDITPAERVMTVRQLFTMTSGLNYNLTSPSILKASENRNATTREIVAAIANEPLDFEPGERFCYSLSHDVLGAVIEVVTKKSLAEYFELALFAPLGMKDTTFHPTEEQKQRLCALYLYDRGAEAPILRENKNEYVFTDAYESGGAGLCTTVNDYMKFANCLACGGKTPDGREIFKSETVKMMQVNHLDPEMKKTFCLARLFGYGWGLCGRVHMNPTVSFSNSAVGEFGWDGAAGAFCLIDPENKIAIYCGMSVFCSSYINHKLQPILINAVYEALGF